ncbi:hypothetical protein BBR47_26580 [Brevibacillus brevis NBRC 100599]|uniref:Uncharacterized protein n=1 Tax=Brevibacillus brevis (strain 47 / JCM 6285 / NBRC 100599) TaxID=358681 RepID=C0ZCX6_BREBN|nr:hypothetical protein BBR47_26580 [Brevibacillus brevis NBRC 100599]
MSPFSYKRDFRFGLQLYKILLSFSQERECFSNWGSGNTMAALFGQLSRKLLSNTGRSSRDERLFTLNRHIATPLPNTSLQYRNIVSK